MTDKHHRVDPALLDAKAFLAVVSGLESDADMLAFAREFKVAPEIVAAWKAGKGAPQVELRGTYARWIGTHVLQQRAAEGVVASVTLSPQQIEALARTRTQTR